MIKFLHSHLHTGDKNAKLISKAMKTLYEAALQKQ